MSRNDEVSKDRKDLERTKIDRKQRFSRKKRSKDRWADKDRKMSEMDRVEAKFRHG